MKINSIKNFAFQKRLVANCKIGCNETRQKAKIYEIEYPQDRQYWYDLIQDENWKNNFYLTHICGDFEEFSDIQGEHFYAMEDKEGKCICISEFDEYNEKQNSLDFIETAPALSTYTKNPNRIKYIGETMLAFLVKKTKEQGKKRFFIPLVANRERTLDFYYTQCGFNRQGTAGSLAKKNYDRFIRSNEEHTNSSISLIK